MRLWRVAASHAWGESVFVTHMLIAASSKGEALTQAFKRWEEWTVEHGFTEEEKNLFEKVSFEVGK
jgi:hypothetical protein